MKSTKSISTFLFVFFLVFMSCQIDDGNSGGNQQQTIPDTFSEYFGNDISRDFIGTAIDKNNLPIEGATITIGDETALTDNNGVFIIRSANVNQRFGYVKAEKVGYIHGSRSIVPSEGTNKVTIMLLEANVVGTINSGSSETVSLANGSSVSFDGNFIKEDGSSYSGSVDVIMHHLDPADDDMPMQMPGMLYAENEDGAERMLQTLGMLAVELRGSGGEDLNLAEGSTSEIKIPVDVSLMGIAPATIPFWYFDETNGYWKEEGIATLQGNMYVGTVSHFSFWNCDIPTETVTLCITITDNENNSLNNLYATITSTIFGTRGGITNENGEICGYVPSGETLELSIYNEACGTAPLYTEMIDPYTADSSISVIVADNTDIIAETVTGNFNTCGGDPVTDGYVQLTYANQTFIDIVTEGTFEINLLRCSASDTFGIIGNDYVNLQTTGIINYTFSNPLTNIGFLSACNTVEEFIYMNKTGINHFSTELNNTITTFFNPESHLIRIDANLINDEDGNAVMFDLYIYLNPENYIDSYTVSLNSNDIGFGFTYFLGMIIEDNYLICNVTSFGEIGEYIDINFNGNYLDWNGNPRSLNGTIHVLRDE